ncbi:NUDIX hydrolase [Bernardetia sp.]|uniref:NUDIX hydrolase n=1 Tax=Bernardetia sp. TaxID=1937974 RepID=UPI0025BBA34F|nr:NUDIX domain-containing protein [Bernardetia sp.]
MRIFIQNNYLEFVNEYPDVTGGRILQTEKLEDSYKLYLSLKTRTEFTRAYIQTDNIEEAFNEFAKKFKIREAAGGLVMRDTLQLWIFRNGKWDLPKGHLEENETKAEAAVREVEEECGVKAEVVKELPTTYHIYTYEGKEIIKKTYWFEMSTEDESTPQPQTEEGIEKVSWLKEIEIPYILNNTWASIEYLLSQIIEF